MTNQRIKAQLIETAFVWATSAILIGGLIYTATTMAPDAIEAFEQFRAAFQPMSK